MHLKMQRALSYHFSTFSALIHLCPLCGTWWHNIGLEQVWCVFIHLM